MTIEQLRTAQHAEPFRPYELRLASGKTVRVKSPEFVAVTPAGRTISVATAEDAFEIIALSFVEALELHDGKAPRRGRR